MLSADTRDPRQRVYGPLLVLLALFSSTLLERLLFLTPCPRAGFKSGLDKFLFFLLLQTLFVELQLQVFVR